MSKTQERAGLLIAESPCTNCLFGKSPVVSAASKAEIVKECDQKDTNFLCHIPQVKGSKEEIICHASYKRRPGQMARIAQRLGALFFVKVEDEYGTAD